MADRGYVVKNNNNRIEVFRVKQVVLEFPCL